MKSSRISIISGLIALLLISSLTELLSARELSLEQSFTLAQEHSFALKKSKAGRDAYLSRLDAAIAERYPTVDLNAVASYRDVVPQLEISIPSGPSIVRDFGTNEAYQADLRLKLPLYTGGKISGNVNLNRSALDLQQALLDLTDDQLLLTVRLAYLALDHADRLVTTARSALTRVELAQKDVHSLFEAGMADSLDILEARRAINNINLQLQAAEINRRKREIELIVLLGFQVDESIQLTSEPSEPDTDNLMFQDVSPDKPELNAARASIGMNRSMVALSRSDYYPTLAMFGGWSYGKPNIDPFHNEFNDYFTIGASLNWSLNLGFKTGKNVTGAKHQLSASEQEYERVSEQLSRDARIAWENVKLSRQQYAVTKQNRLVAQDNYRLAQTQFKEGTLAANRLLDIEEALTQAESSLAAAKTDYNSAMSQYLFLIGSEKLKEGFQF